MENIHPDSDRAISQEHIMTVTLKLGFMALLIILSYLILKPFFIMVLWGVIIAVGIYPVYQKFSAILGNRKKLASILITLTALAIIILPSILLLESTIKSVQFIAHEYEAGSLVIAAPDPRVADWPLVGGTIYETWDLASTNLTAAIKTLEPQIREYGPQIISTVAGLGGTVLISIISIIIAGVLLLHAESSSDFARRIFDLLTGRDGEEFSGLAAKTIRSVVQGVMGIAVIQSIATGIVMLVFGIPAAGLWALLVLVLAIIQLPPILILLPVSIYGFSIMDTTMAVILLIMCIMISLVDNVLKPLFLGRGVDVPMLIILLGAIGGMIAFGILGLFVGSVILALAYKVLQALMIENAHEKESVKIK